MMQCYSTMLVGGDIIVKGGNLEKQKRILWHQIIKREMQCLLVVEPIGGLTSEVGCLLLLKRTVIALFWLEALQTSINLERIRGRLTHKQ